MVCWSGPKRVLKVAYEFANHVGGKSIKSGSAEGTVRSSADSTEPSVEKVVRQVGGMCWHQSVPKEPSERVVR